MNTCACVVKVAVVAAVASLALVMRPAQACPEYRVESALYRQAEAMVKALPEYQRWAARVARTPHSHVATVSDEVGKQVLIRRYCYIPIELSEDLGDHLAHWNTFYVNVVDQKILVEDVTGEGPLSLDAWRASHH